MITSLIDFSFIRSLVADCFSEYGPACYDPPSLFLLDLFRDIDGYQNMSKFLELLRDKDRGRAYRSHSGILDNIPCETTFSLRGVGSLCLYEPEAFHTQIDCQPYPARMNGLIPPGSFASQSVPMVRCFLVLESLPFFTPEVGRFDML